MVLARRIQLSLALTVFLLLNLAGSSRAEGANSTEEKDTEKKSDVLERKYKVFPIFNVVNFNNAVCRSNILFTLSGPSTVRNGTCFTQSECTSKGGTASGNCASGFGVCCVFIVNTSGSTISTNNTYIQNPGFPTALTTTVSATSYTISKCSPSICWIRLDFENFAINGPSTSLEATGGTCATDFLTITTSTTQKVPVICGINTGLHVYIDIGAVSTDTISLAFTMSNAVTTLTNSRTWDIRESQIECTNLNRPPAGCLQYYTTLTGRIMTFNFNPTGTSTSVFQHLAQQEYSACIRRDFGFCCVQYQVCMDSTFTVSSVPTSFTLDESTVAVGTVKVDSQCTNDYIGIQGSSGTCSANSVGLSNKYCGNYLNQDTIAIAMNIPICDCTPPFFVHVHTDNAGIAASEQTAAAILNNRGVCLDYMQIPCTTN